MGSFLSNVWDFVWLFFLAFVFIAYLMAIFNVIGDLFRDHNLNGFAKALWLIFLIFLPFLTVLAYLIFRGAGMSERRSAQYEAAEASANEYIRKAAGVGPADDISKAKALLDSGAITQKEFEALKAKALA